MAASASQPRARENVWSSAETFAAWTEDLLALEQEAEREETTELLLTCSQAELQARGIAILKLAVSEQATALYGRACVSLERPGGGGLPAHRLGSGDIVGLFDSGTRPLSKAVPLASAVVHRVRPNSISLTFDGEVPLEILDGRALHIATISSEVTMKRYREALDVLKAGRADGPAAELLSFCFSDGAKPRFREEKSEECGRADAVDCTFRSVQAGNLNEPQQDAVKRSLRAVDAAIIHGPPGTGKTTTLVAYILEAAYRKQRLLVTAPSNVAVDNLLERVVDCGLRSVVRLGHPTRVQSELHKYTMDNVVYGSDQASLCRDIKKEIEDAIKRSHKASKSKEERQARSEISELRKELRQRERRAVAEVLRHTQVVFATCAGSAQLHREIRRGGGGVQLVDGSGKKSLEFDVVIIDEAGQALEVACWIPLLLGRKGIMAGDHQQLAATVKSTGAQKAGLDTTLFARLIDKHGDDISALLAIQYRMNTTIMGWSSKFFYSSRLVAAESVADRALELQEVPSENLTGEIVTAMRAPLLFVDTGGLPQYREDQSGEAEEKARKAQNGGSMSAALHQSRANPGEAHFVVHYAKLLAKCGLRPQDLTVITPYSRQVEQLVVGFAEDDACEKLGLQRPRVNTVDSFQGQEADAVLISLVRSNERGSVGFLSDYRRLNVAVTRARKHVMLVGDAATISNDKVLASLYDYACENGTVLFVQQLLDDDTGLVPADPSMVSQAPASKAKAQAKVDQHKSQEKVKLKEEEQLRAKFEQQFRALLAKGGNITLPAKLNSFERAIAHDVATALGLKHESVGEGAQRQLRVWTASQKDASGYPEAAASAAAPMATATTSSQEIAKALPQSETESEGESQLEAFERRAREAIKGLGTQKKRVEWKAPSPDEMQVLERLAQEADLELEVLGTGKKQRCWIEVDAELEPAAAAKGSDTSARQGAAAAADLSASSCKGEQAPQQQEQNSLLASLHAARKQRAEKEAEERRKEIEEKAQQLKQAKKEGKVKRPGVAKPADDAPEDFDSILEEFSTSDRTCAFGPCKEKINTLVDMISKCKHCGLRFCLAHAQAECHGCGDAARVMEQQKWKKASAAAASSSGSGLQGKSAGADGRPKVENKLRDKIKEQAAARTAKKKDKK